MSFRRSFIAAAALAAAALSASLNVTAHTVLKASDVHTRGYPDINIARISQSALEPGVADVNVFNRPLVFSDRSTQ